MCPEYGATAAFFPVDAVSIRYLEQTGEPLLTSAAHLRPACEAVPIGTSVFATRTRPGAAGVHQGLPQGRGHVQGLLRRRPGPGLHPGGCPYPLGHAAVSVPTRLASVSRVHQVVELDLGTVEPCCSGPKRPQDRIPVSHMKEDFESCLGAKVGTDPPGGWRGALAEAQDVTSLSPPPTARLQGLPGGSGAPRRRHALPLRRGGVLAGPRLGGHRRHHQLHQHQQPLRHAGSRWVEAKVSPKQPGRQ